MHTVNYLPATKTIIKTRSSKRQISGNMTTFTYKWTNVLPSDKLFTNPPKDKTKQITTHSPSKKIDLRTASQTVDNSMNNDEDLLLGLKQITKIIIPDFNQFKSILREDNDEVPPIGNLYPNWSYGDNDTQ